MAEPITLARPYAKAAFEYARHQNNIQGWFEALTVAAKVALNERVTAVFDVPSFTAEQKSVAFIELCGDALNGHQQNFIHVLAKNGRLGLLLQIQELFEQYKANQEKTISVEVETPYVLSPELHVQLTETLKRKLNREVSLNTSIDATLIGGALIRAGNAVIDASVKGRLAQLSNAFGH